ncbi:hypothetical protein [Longimicrobium sp.]|nr:hypothetical protein [Longimicrobium sp.]HSU14851.1 hypothetical protein [Longimicrobium sp.]
MPKKTLDPEALRIETFATTAAASAPTAGEAKMSAVTSCPKPPYCTC